MSPQSVEATTKTVEINHADDFACEIPDIIRDVKESGTGERVQRFEVDEERCEYMTLIPDQVLVLDRIKEALAASDDHPEVPDDKDRFALAGPVTVAVDEMTELEIEVYD